MPIELGISMYPSMLTKGDTLLRAQLKCLSTQECKDFEVVLVDHHYHTRKYYIDELRDKYKLNIIHVPYLPNNNIAKITDAGVFNIGYLFSEAKKNVRLSDWRFVTNDFTKVCLESTTAVDFRFHNCQPVKKEDICSQYGHDLSIWNGIDDNVYWNNIPKYGDERCRWGEDSEYDAPAENFPLNCYGNICTFRDDWIYKLNGCDEAFTNVGHYEDLDFCRRANRAGIQCKRVAKKLYRMHHIYSPFDGRANVKPDGEFKKPCDSCNKAINVLEPTRFDLQNRLNKNEIELFDNKVWVCKSCLLCGPNYSKDPEEHLRSVKGLKSTIIKKYKIGRNLGILADDMQNKLLNTKFHYFYDSYTNERYYE